MALCLHPPRKPRTSAFAQFVQKGRRCPAPRTSSETPTVAGGVWSEEAGPTLTAQPLPKQHGRATPKVQWGSWLGLGERRPVASQLLLLCCSGLTALVGGTDAEAEAPVLWPPDEKASSLEKVLMLGKTEGRRRRGQQRTGWLHGITNSMHESEPAPGDSEGQGSLARAIRGVAESQDRLRDSNTWQSTLYTALHAGAGCAGPVVSLVSVQIRWSLAFRE